MTRKQVKRGLCALVAVGGMLGLASSAVWANDLPKAGTWSLGMQSGYTISADSGSRKIEKVPVHLRIGYTAFQGSKWFLPKGSLEIATEPFGSILTQKSQGRGFERHKGSFEVGLMLPVLTYHFDLGIPFYPYIEGGLGVMYQDLQGYDLGGGFNFAEMVGGGGTYFIDDNLAINFGYRFRHASNASLYDENRGLNTHTFTAGFSYLLPAQ